MTAACIGISAVSVGSRRVGYDGRGKRLVRHGYGRTKTEAKAKLRDLLRSHEDGLVLTRDGYTVRQAVEDWLEHGLGSRDKATRDANRDLCEKARASIPRSAKAA